MVKQFITIAMSYPYQIKVPRSNITRLTKKVSKNPATFWSEIAAHFTWHKKWDQLDWNFKDPKVEWFKGGKLNITENCLDRHLETKGDQPAIIWEPNDPEEHHRIITYKQLHI